jgi:hypothetical protein
MTHLCTVGIMPEWSSSKSRSYQTRYQRCLHISNERVKTVLARAFGGPINVEIADRNVNAESRKFEIVERRQTRRICPSAD